MYIGYTEEQEAFNEWLQKNGVDVKVSSWQRQEPNTFPSGAKAAGNYLNSQLGAWRIDQRRAQEPDCMAQIAGRIGPDDVAAVTAWLASQPVPAASQPASLRPPTTYCTAHFTTCCASFIAPSATRDNDNSALPAVSNRNS